MTIEPPILRQYGLGADVSRIDHIITSSSEDRPLFLIPSLKPESDQVKVTVGEVKDLKASPVY
jgi:hypothetical protein